MTDGKSFCDVMQITGVDAINLQERWESLTDDWTADTLPFFLDEAFFSAVFLSPPTTGTVFDTGLAGLPGAGFTDITGCA